MTPTLKDILNALEEIAPSYIAEDWDNPGLQTGHLSQEINKIFLALDPTLKAVKEASSRNARLLLTHHPLIFKPLSSINRGIYPSNVIFEAFEKGISIVAAHTNLDMAKGGINDLLADLFGLQDIEVLMKRDDPGLTGIGLGRVGYLPEPVKLSTLIHTVKEILGTLKVMVVGHKNTTINKVAVIGGSGGGMVGIAVKNRADLLITGDVGHHDAMEAEALGLALIDGGHFYTEKAAFLLFAERLKNIFSDLGWEITVEGYKDEVSPMRYE